MCILLLCVCLEACSKMVMQWCKDNLQQGHKSNHCEAEIALHEENCNVIFLKMHVAS